MTALYVEDETWMERAACKGVNPDVFFPDNAHDGAQARAICAGCEVRVDCMAYAVNTNVRFGIWAGKSFGRNRRLEARWRAS